MNRSAKEKKYDNKTADYITGKASTKKTDSIAREPDEVDEKENPKIIIGKEENPNPDN